MPRSTLPTLAAAALLALAGCASAPPTIPLPPDAHVAAAAPSLPANVRGFAGKWTGYWARPDGRLPHMLVVEEITGTQAKVISAVGSLITPHSSVDAGWFRTTGTFDGNGQLTLNLRGGHTAVYQLQPDGQLRGIYKSPHFSAPLSATLVRAPA